MTTPTRSATVANMRHPRSQAAFRNVKLLIGGYLGLSVLTLVAIFLMRNDTAEVNAAVWTRGAATAASAALTLFFAIRATQGHRGAFTRLRVISSVMVLVIVAIITLPGEFPLWMKIEQGACGLALLAVALIVNTKHVRSLFPKR